MKFKNLIAVSLLIASGYCYSQRLSEKIGTNPTIIEASAVVEIESTTKGFLPPRMTIAQRNSIVSPVAGLMVYCTNCVTNGQLSVFNGVVWTNLSNSNVTAYVYTSSGGILEFMNHNLGADTSADPFTPSWRLNGAYFQWGKKPVDTNGDGYRTKTNDGANGFAAGPIGTATNETNSGLVASWSSTMAASNAWSNTKTVNDPCPTGYRVPTQNEWVSIMPPNNIWTNVGTWTNDPTNYTAGKIVAKTLYLPAAGYRDISNGVLGGRSAYGYYWSSTFFNTTESLFVYFTSTDIIPINYTSTRQYGHSIRCIKQ